MTPTMEEVWALVSRRIGDRVSMVSRMFYDFQGQIDERDGEVEVQFGPSVLRIGSSNEGELVKVCDTPWQDPFAGPMTPENMEFVSRYGRWIRVDVSTRPKYADLVGQSLSAALPLTNRFGRLIGLQFQLGETLMNVFVHADEIIVSWGKDGVPRWGHEWVDE